MSTFDYASIITIAQELLLEFGRSVTFIAFDATSSDVSQPWLGPTDPRATPSATLPLDAAFVEPDAADALGHTISLQDLIQRSEQILIVSPGAAVDLSVYQEVIDSDASRWKIEGFEILKPGDDVVLSFVGLKR